MLMERPIFLWFILIILFLLPASDSAEVVEEPNYSNATQPNILLPRSPYDAIGDTITNLLRFAGEDLKNIVKEEIFAKAVKLFTSLTKEKHSSHADQIDRQKYPEQKIESLKKKMRKWMAINGYTDDESLIKNSVWYLDRHLHNPDDKESLNDFYKLAAKLPRHMNNILDGMLGRNSLSADIMIGLRKAEKCHVRKLNEKIFGIMAIVFTGFDVYTKFEEMKETSNKSISYFKESITKSINEVTERLVNMTLQCRMNETTVDKEMRDIIDKNSGKRRKDIAKSILHFLEDKYDTKKWMVMVLSEKHRILGDVKVIQSGGFHTVATKDVFVLAISNGAKNQASQDDREDETLLSAEQRSFLKEFKIPYHFEHESTSSLLDWPSSFFSTWTTIINNWIPYFNYLTSIFNYWIVPFFNALWDYSTSVDQVAVTHDYLGRYLTPLRTGERFHVEFLVITDPKGYCGLPLTESKPQSYWKMYYSEGFEHFRMNQTSCPDDSASNVAPRKYTAMIVPTRPSWMSFPIGSARVPQHQDSIGTKSCFNCFPSNSDGRMLRNEFFQGYLSVLDDSNKDGAQIVIDLQWKNISLGQKWQFANNQLRNGYGKCLTSDPDNDLLYQQQCDVRSSSQSWTRHGLQIVKPHHQQSDSSDLYCVTVEGRGDGSLRLVLDKCLTNPRYLWYDWETKCEDDVAIHIPKNSHGRPLRNELSRRYLGAQVDGVKHGPWMNLPGQRWRFVDRYLKNDEGMCLVGNKERGIVKKDCAEAETLKTLNNWKRNDKGQIESNEGYCLTTAEEFNGGNKYCWFLQNVKSAAPSLYEYWLLFETMFKDLVPLLQCWHYEGGLGEYVYYDNCKDVPEQKWLLLNTR